MACEVFASVTKASGQTASISAAFSTTFPSAARSASNTSIAFGAIATTLSPTAQNALVVRDRVVPEAEDQLRSGSPVAAAGALATVLAFPVALLALRHAGRVRHFLERSTYLVLGIPGVVVAFALSYFAERYVAGFG